MYILNHAVSCWKEKLEGRKHMELDLAGCVDRSLSDRFSVSGGEVTFICTDTADLLDYPMQVYTFGIADRLYTKEQKDGATTAVKLQGDLSFIVSAYRLKQGEGIFIRFRIPEEQTAEATRVQAGILLAEPFCTDRLDAGWETDTSPGFKALQMDLLEDRFEISCVSHGQQPAVSRMLHQGAYNPSDGRFFWNRACQGESAAGLHEYGACNVPVAFAQSAPGDPYKILLQRGEWMVGQSEGYVYLDPIDLSEYSEGCSIMMMSQGKCELQYHDADQGTWQPYTGKFSFTRTTARFRIKMESGSKIIKMAVVQ